MTHLDHRPDRHADKDLSDLKDLSGICSAFQKAKADKAQRAHLPLQKNIVQKKRSFSKMRQILDVLSLMPHGGPNICNITVTNVCNAACDFCGYSRDKQLISERKWMDFDRLCRALDSLYRRGVRYLTFSGGEPTLHPNMPEMVAYAVSLGMRPSVVTNGFTLTEARIAELAQAGLKTMFISIDAPKAEDHEKNRGLKGVFGRIAHANTLLKRYGIKTVASVTVNKLIDDFEHLATTLKELGFETVTFTYPKRDLNSSSLVFSDSSSLIDYSEDEMVQALENVQTLKKHFPVLNPAESLREIIRLTKKEKQYFPCYGGYKYFWLDIDFNIYRCDFWATPMGPVEDFETMAFIRDDCQMCNSVCYRDSSVFLHFPVSIGDALRATARGRFDKAFMALAQKTNWRSLKSLISEWRTLKKLARTES